MAGWPRCSRGWPHSPTVGQHYQRCGKPVIWGFGRTDQDVALYTANSSKNPEITTAGPADDDSSDDNGEKNPGDSDDEERHEEKHGKWNKRKTYSVKHHLPEFQDLQNTCCRTVTTILRKLGLNSRTAGDGAG